MCPVSPRGPGHQLYVSSGGPGRCRCQGPGPLARGRLEPSLPEQARRSRVTVPVTAQDNGTTARLDRPAKAIKQGTKRVFVVGSRESVRRVRAVESCQVDGVQTMHRLGRPAVPSFPGDARHSLRIVVGLGVCCQPPRRTSWPCWNRKCLGAKNCGRLLAAHLS